MKKFVLLSLISFLILAFGATVYGQEKAPVLDFKASGFVDASATTYRNVAGSGGALYGPPAAADLPALDRSNAWVNERARLKFDAIMGKELSGTIFFEMDSTRWGDLGAGRNTMGAVAADQVALEIKNVYLDFGVPVIPVPITVRAGVQTMGVRAPMLLLTDMAGVTVGVKPVDPLTLSLMWGKLWEGLDANADDTDLYGLHAAFKVETMTVGGYGLYYNMNTYPIPAAAAAYGVNAPYSASIWWLGAYVDGKLGPINLNFDFIYDTGTVEDHQDVVTHAKDVDYSGWATAVKVAFPWEKFEFGGKFLYASGNDLKKTSATGLPGSATPWGTITDKVGGYVVPPASEAFGAFGEDVVFYGTWMDRGGFGNGVSKSYTQVHRGAFGGTWFAKLFAKIAMTPDFKVTAQGIYIGDTTKNGNTIGNAVKSTGEPRDDSYIGIEADLITEYKIYKNLKWDVGFGWLFAGDGLDYNIAGNNESAKDPWRLVTQIIYSF